MADRILAMLVMSSVMTAIPSRRFLLHFGTESLPCCAPMAFWRHTQSSEFLKSEKVLGDRSEGVECGR